MGPCAFCRQTVEVPATCPRCRALYHADCWVANDRRCAIYGCEPARAAVPPPPPRPVDFQPVPAQPANMGWVVFGILLLSSLSRFASSGKNERPSWTPPSESNKPAPRLLQADALEMRAEMILLRIPPRSVPADAELRAKRVKDLTDALSLLLQAREVAWSIPPGQIQRLDLRIAEVRRLRDD